MSCRSRDSACSLSTAVARQNSQRCSTRRGNFVGKLTQSVRRIVKEVKEDPVDTGQSREEAIQLSERLRGMRQQLVNSLSVAKQALVEMHKKYDDSQEVRSPFAKYKLRKAMIKEVIRLEMQYWALIEIPRQQRGETTAAFVLRASSVLDCKTGASVVTGVPGGGSSASGGSAVLVAQQLHSQRVHEADEEQQDHIDRLDGLTTSQIVQENNTAVAELARRLKTYLSLRAVIKQLMKEYTNSKMFPFVARYYMLGDMIRSVVNDPDYMDIYAQQNIN